MRLLESVAPAEKPETYARTVAATAAAPWTHSEPFFDNSVGCGPESQPGSGRRVRRRTDSADKGPPGTILGETWHKSDLLALLGRCPVWGGPDVITETLLLPSLTLAV